MSAAETATYTYDALGRVVAVQHADGSSDGSTIEYTYDAVGNRTREQIASPENQQPSAVADSATIIKNTPVTLDPRVNDSDPEGDVLAITAITQPGHGSVSYTETSVTYTPATDNTNADSFTYTVTDRRGASATATVSMLSPPTALTARADTLLVNKGTAATFDPLGNDYDPEGDALAITSVGVAAHGSATYSATSLTYTPAASYVGPDSFTYSISDGHGSTASTTVDVTVQSPPMAVADPVTVIKNSQLSFDPRANDTDVDGDTLRISAVTSPGHGRATFTASSITYRPEVGYSGPDSFTYTVSDGRGGFGTAGVTVTVQGGPSAVDDAKTFTKNTPLTFDPRGNDTDPEGDALTVTAANPPSHGTTTFTAGSITYSPAPDHVGPDSFTYVVSDGRGGSAAATVNLQSAPIAVADSRTINKGAALTFDPVKNDEDGELDGLTLVSVTQPGHGTVSNNLCCASVTYLPAANFTGTDSFTYTISDGHGGSATGTVTVTVQSVPIAQSDYRRINKNTPLQFDPRDNDSDPDLDSITITSVAPQVSPSTRGTAQVNASGTLVTYTPPANYTGLDFFRYKISDGRGGVAETFVTIDIQSPPVAVGDSISTGKDTATTFDPRLNDTDADNNSLTITGVGPAAHGTVAFTGTSVTYTPSNSYFGSDSFTYTISDGKGGNASATVEVTVLPNVIPAPYNLGDPITNGVSDTWYESAVVAPAGLDAPATISIANGQYRINDRPWTALSGTLQPGETVQVRVAAPSAGGATQTATLDIGGMTDTFQVTTAVDTAPNPFDLLGPVTGAASNTTYTSVAVIPVGFNADAPISISGGSYRIDGQGAWITAPGTLKVGQSVEVSVVSPFAGGMSQTATLNIGGVTDTFQVTTAVDTTPATFNLGPAVTNAVGGTWYLSAPVSPDGFNAASPISITNGQYRVDGQAWQTAASTLQPAQPPKTVEVRVQAPSAGGTSQTATLNIGGVTGTFQVTTIVDTTPNQFDLLGPVTGAASSTPYTSVAITPTGFNADAPISISGGGYRINGQGNWLSTPGWLKVGQSVEVNVISPFAGGATQTATLNIGGVTDTYQVTTAVDTAPDAFELGDPQVGATAGTWYVSAAPMVSGFNTAAPVSITGGEYRKDGGAWTAASGTVQPYQTVQVRAQAAVGSGATQTATLNIGGVTDTYQVVTAVAANQPPTAVNDTVYLTTSNNLAMTIWVNVRANDTDPNGDALTITSVTDPAGIASTSIDSGQVKVTSLTVGTTTFSYTISDGHGGTSTATVTIVREYDSGA